MVLERPLIHLNAMNIYETGTNVRGTMTEVIHGCNSDLGLVLEAHLPREYLNFTVSPKSHRPPYQCQEERHTEPIREVQEFLQDYRISFPNHPFLEIFLNDPSNMVYGDPIFESAKRASRPFLAFLLQLPLVMESFQEYGRTRLRIILVFL